MDSGLTVNIKMFQVGELGDCFLLEFRDNGRDSNVLIDCGSFRNSEKSKKRLGEIVDTIKNDLKGKKLDLVIGTHQHNDHLSGFAHCGDIFKGMISQVWLSWLDDPKDSLARQVGKDHKSLVKQVKAIHAKMKQHSMKARREVLEDVLGFYAAANGDPEVPANGLRVLKTAGDKPVKYLKPGDIIPIPGLPQNSVKVYVLGPPRNQDLLFDKNPSKSETYDPHLAFASVNAQRMLSALANQGNGDISREEQQFPFNSSYKITVNKANDTAAESYHSRMNNWRKIDDDWLMSAERLGLYLDSFTNNTSLVIAIELVQSGKVLLFVGDAQTGNWNSWYNIKWKKQPAGFGIETLLQNTVLYKVGHHASHNATLVKALEAMEHEELVAMIPVDKTDPNIKKEKGWKMPARNLFNRLREKTKYRVLRMDEGFAEGCDPVKNKDKSRWKDVEFKPKVNKDKGWVEYKVRG